VSLAVEFKPVPVGVVASCGAFPPQGSSVQTIFSPNDTPQLPTNTDNRPLVLGLRFRSSVIGDITGFRFFKPASETGSSHMGRVYTSATKELLGTTGTFSDVTCAGPQWVSAPLTEPIRTTVGTEYVIAADSLLFYAKTEATVWPKVSGPLSATGALYGFVSGQFPVAASWMNAHYWIDGKSRPIYPPYYGNASDIVVRFLQWLNGVMSLWPIMCSRVHACYSRPDTPAATSGHRLWGLPATRQQRADHLLLNRHTTAAD
jgi:hypothetical protein